jgi:lysophospholipase L1-like esterase
MIKRVVEIPALLLLLALGSILQAEILIPASDQNINYYGRFDKSTASQVRFNWSGCIIEASFPGPSIGIELSDGQADYDVEIDGAPDTILRTVSSTTHYTFRTNLSTGSHTVRLMQRSENHWNAAVFKGFYLADGKALLPAPAKPERKIEFIGDSYTAGYGNESPGRTCSSEQLRAYTNANKSFGPLVTKAFHAQSVVLGYSGAGMVRNYGESSKKSEKPFPYYYGKVLGDVSGEWNFTQWTPDLAVICLGTNDFSTTPYPDDTSYKNAYHTFIGRVLGNYPDASILCVTTHTGPMDNYVKQVVAAEVSSKGHPKVYYAEFPQSLAMNGCDYHPSAADDKAIAAALIDTIMKRVGWDTGMVASCIPSHGRPDPQELRFTLLGAGGDIMISAIGAVKPETAVDITTLQGRLVAQGTLDKRNCFYWNARSMPSGCYLARLQGTGLTCRIVNRRP